MRETSTACIAPRAPLIIARPGLCAQAGLPRSSSVPPPSTPWPGDSIYAWAGDRTRALAATGPSAAARSARPCDARSAARPPPQRTRARAVSAPAIAQCARRRMAARRRRCTSAAEAQSVQRAKRAGRCAAPRARSRPAARAHETAGRAVGHLRASRRDFGPARVQSGAARSASPRKRDRAHQHLVSPRCCAERCPTARECVGWGDR